MKVFLVIILNFYCYTLYAQIRVDACISVNKGKVCVGEKLTVTNCIVRKGTTSDIGLLNFGDSDVPIDSMSSIGPHKDTSHIYSKPGYYKITEQGGTKNGVLDDTTIIIRVIDQKSIDFNVFLCEDKVALFQLKEVTDDLNFLQPGDNFKDTVFQYRKDTLSAIKYVYSDTLPKKVTVKTECGSTISHTISPISKLYKADIKSVEGIMAGNQKLAKVKVSGLPYLKYQIIISSDSGKSNKFLKGLPQDTTLTYPIPSSNVCFQIVALDDCGNTDSSSIICINALNGATENNQVRLNWNNRVYADSNAVSSYNVLRDGISIASLSPTVSSFSDTTVRCGTKYMYVIKGIKKEKSSAGVFLYGTSVPVSVTSASTKIPPAVKDLRSEIQENKIALSWDKPFASSVKLYNLSKSVNGADYKNIASLSTSNYLDKDVEIPGNFYSYKVNFTDSCGLTSLISSVSAPVILNGQKSKEDKVSIIFNKYNISSKSTYILERLDDHKNIVSIVNLNSDTLFLDPLNYDSISSIYYRVKVLINGIKDSITYSNILTISNELEIYFPTIFTPNADGRNEEYLVFCRRFSSFIMSIYNRWGELIFQSDDIKKGWDGYYKNSPSEPDNYVCLIKVKSFSGKEVTKKGSFILVR